MEKGHDINLFWQGYHRIKKAVESDGYTDSEKEAVGQNVKRLVEALELTSQVAESRETITAQDAIYLGVLEMWFALAIPPRKAVDTIGQESDRLTDFGTFRELLEDIENKLS